jgi:flagellar motility protein MotE (MotC chaperone)
MNLEHATRPASAQDEASVDEAADLARRTRRRRKAKTMAAPAVESLVETPAETTAAAQSVPETKPESAATPAPVPNIAPAERVAAPRAISVLPPRAQEPKPTPAPRPSFLKRHGALAAGMAVALGLGAYAGTQVGFDHPEAAPVQEASVNVAAALPWKRDVAMASTQAREIGRLKEELRGMRAQIDALRASPDQARQAQELRSLRASIETLKEGLTAARADTANAIAQVSSGQVPKVADQLRVEKLAERLDRLERQVADPTPMAAIPQKSEPPKPVALQDPHALPTPADVAAAVQKADPKQKVFHNYVVREVADGVALIEGPDGLREVWPGRGIPGAGKVTSIERQAGKWVVITSEGMIEYKRDAYSRN